MSAASSLASYSLRSPQTTGSPTAQVTILRGAQHAKPGKRKQTTSHVHTRADRPSPEEAKNQQPNDQNDGSRPTIVLIAFTEPPLFY